MFCNTLLRQSLVNDGQHRGPMGSSFAYYTWVPIRAARCACERNCCSSERHYQSRSEPARSVSRLVPVSAGVRGLGPIEGGSGNQYRSGDTRVPREPESTGPRGTQKGHRDASWQDVWTDVGLARREGANMISQRIPVFDVTILIGRIQRRSAHILSQAPQKSPQVYWFSVNWTIPFWS